MDERVVPKDHEDSNYKLALDGFLSKVFFSISWTGYILFLQLLESCLYSFTDANLFYCLGYGNLEDKDQS